MSAINNDKQLRQQLDLLDIAQQRLLAVLLIQSVMHLNNNEQIKKAMKLAENPASSEEELHTAYNQIKFITTQSYTDCGSETDWKQQAQHFVAAALMASLTPENQLIPGKSLVWKAAMQARMAKNCEMIDKDSAEIDNEAIKQYQLVSKFLEK